MRSTRISPSPAASRFAGWVQHALANVDTAGWRAFALSIVALALAFLLAMYSTIFAQQGRLISTAVSALSALALAAYVGFTAIPYLARRTQIEWLQVSLDYKLTREGWTFILLILLLAVAGLNTGNNLLYLILSTLLASLLMSGMLSLAVLNGVAIELEIPAHVFARRPVEAVVVLENLKRYFPSFSLTLRGTQPAGSDGRGAAAEKPPWRTVLGRAAGLGVIGGVLAAVTWLTLWKVTSDFFGLRTRSLVGITVFSLLVSIGMAVAALAYRERKRRRGSASGTLRSAALRSAPPGILEQPIYFPFLGRGNVVRRHVELEFPRRGHYREDGLDLSTRFPFGFLEKTMHVGISHELLVYPAVKPSEYFRKILPLISGEVQSFQRGMGHDLYSLREMQGSDSVRHVDWKASARTGTMMVREFAREDDRRVQLVLDVRAGARDAAAQAINARFEAAVEFCACLAWHFHETGTVIEFVCGDYRSRTAAANEIIYDILERLAEVQPTAESLLEALELPDEESVFRIVCTLMPPDAVPPEQSQRAHFLRFHEMPQPA